MSSNNSTVPASSTAPASSSPAPISSSELTSSIEPSTSTPVDTSTPTSSQQTTAAPTTNDFTSTLIASSLPPTTIVQTHVVTNSGETPSTIVVTVTSSASRTTVPVAVTNTDSSSSAASSTAPSALPGQSGKDSNNGGLSAGGKTAIAVVIPVVVVALLVLGGIFLWRRRKQRKNAEEARRKEVEEYGFNPNNDPTLPAVAGMGGSEMAEDSSGYRGWGNTTASARNPSTTLSGGHTQLSDTGSNPGGYHSPGSPTMATGSDGHSADPLMANRRETMDSETIGALGAAPAAGTNRSDIHRGPSNASSSYSAANHSDHSGDAPIPVSGPQDYYTENAYYQQGPYGTEPYGGQQQPIIRDVQARRNTRIENPSVFPQQGNSGISANF